MKNIAICKGIFVMLFIASMMIIFENTMINCNKIKKESLREIIDIKSESDFEEAIKGRILVYFFKNNCNTCDDLTKDIEIAEKEEKNVKIAYVNIDENPEIAKKYNVQNVPTIDLFSKGKKIQTVKENDKNFK